MSASPTPLLQVRRLAKRFGPNYALRSVNLQVHPGEFHGLVGENGSGKSTLVKILAGIQRPEEDGELLCRGQRLALPITPAAAFGAGLRFVHQDLGLVGSMTVLENIAAGGTYSTRWYGGIKWKTERRRTIELLERFAVQVDPSTGARELSGAERAMVAVLRAVRAGEDQEAASSRSAGVYVLDEPTSYLSTGESERLILFLKRLAEMGNGVLLVSHHLAEIVANCTWISVLRDGELVWSQPGGSVTTSELAQFMTGAANPGVSGRAAHQNQVGNDHPRLRVSALSGGKVASASFEVREGEIVGLTGLEGTGYDEIPYLIFGVGREGGTISVDGEASVIRSPTDAIRWGIGFVPGNRLREGIIAGASVRENVSLPALASLSRAGILSRRKEQGYARSLIRRFHVMPEDPELPIAALSGGNQQKSVVGKWLSAGPRVILLAQPTQGVDVGSREAIYGHVRACASEGAAVLIASNDFEELVLLCDRVLAFRRSGSMGELCGSALTEEAIAQLCQTSA